MHSVANLVDQNITNNRQNSRMLLAVKNQDLTKKKPSSFVDDHGGNGFFMFGGLDENKWPTNDLFYVRPDLKQNAKTISKVNGEFKHNLKPEVHVIVTKLAGTGRAPVARS